ncbi:MAG: divergent PAP2 family protein [Clostridia bacterium]|nr:divergent PAP2 family protein [Clostridia bacterium]
MDYVVDFICNGVFIVPVISWFIAQVLKLFLNLAIKHKMELGMLWTGGGMPSSHSATVGALAAVTGWTCGFGSVFFAISAIFAAVVMHDAMNVRFETGKQSTSIKRIAELVNNLLIEKDEEVRTEKLKELVGHTPLQVFMGFTIGVTVAVMYCIIMGHGYECFAGGAAVI